MEEMDEIEIYVAIADYVPEEESNIPLHCGQHVQVCVCLCVCVCVFVCIHIPVYVLSLSLCVLSSTMCACVYVYITPCLPCTTHIVH